MLRGIFLSLIFAVFVCGKCCSEEENSALTKELSQEIQTCLAADTAREANQCLEQLALESPDNKEFLEKVYTLKGEVWFGCYNYERAADEYEKAIEYAQEPKNVATIQFYLGDALVETCKYDEALEEYNKSIESMPEEKEKAYANRGIVQIYLGNSDAALEDFNRMIETRGDVNDYMNITQLYLSRGDSKNAAKYTRMADKAIEQLSEEEKEKMEHDIYAINMLKGWFEVDDDHLPSDLTFRGISNISCSLALDFLLLKYYMDFTDAETVYKIAGCFLKENDVPHSIQYLNRYLCISDNEEKKATARNTLDEMAKSNVTCAKE